MAAVQPQNERNQKSNAMYKSVFGEARNHGKMDMHIPGDKCRPECAFYCPASKRERGCVNGTTGICRMLRKEPPFPYTAQSGCVILVYIEPFND